MNSAMVLMARTAAVIDVSFWVMLCWTRSPITKSNTSSKAVSSPSSRLPSARSTSHTKTNTTAARITMSIALLVALARSRRQPGLERGAGDRVVVVIQHGHEAVTPEMATELDLHVERHRQGVAGRTVEAPDHLVARRGRRRRFGIDRVAVEQLEIGARHRDRDVVVEAAPALHRDLEGDVEARACHLRVVHVEGDVAVARV